MGKAGQKMGKWLMGKWARNGLVGKHARNGLMGKWVWHVTQQLTLPLVQQFVGQFVGHCAGQFVGHFAGHFTWQWEKGSSQTLPEQPREAASRLLVWKDEHAELLSAHPH